MICQRNHKNINEETDYFSSEIDRFLKLIQDYSFLHLRGTLPVIGIKNNAEKNCHPRKIDSPKDFLNVVLGSLFQNLFVSLRSI